MAKPGRPCAICTHPKRREIDRALIRMKGRRGEGYRAIAGRYKVGRSSLSRHFNQHVLKSVRGVQAVAEEEAGEVQHGIDLLAWIARDRESLEAVRERAENRMDSEGEVDPDDKMLIEVVKASARQAEVVGKVQGDIPAGEGQPIEIEVNVAGEG